MRVEPADHAVGRSRGGLSTKIHQLCDGAGLPLVMLIGPGQGGDSPMLSHLLAALKIHRRAGTGPGRPWSTPMPCWVTRPTPPAGPGPCCAARGIQAGIPEPSDQIGHRKRRGRAGGRPPALDVVAYKRRNVVERGFNTFKQWRALATRYDKLALTYRAGVVLRVVVLWLTALGDTP